MQERVLAACITVWWTAASSCNDADISHDFGMAEVCALTVTIEINPGCSSCCEADCGLVGQGTVCLMLNRVTYFMKYILIISSLVIFRIARCHSCCPPRVLHASPILPFTVWFLPISGHSADFSGGQQHRKAAIREEATFPSAMIYIPCTSFNKHISSFLLENRVNLFAFIFIVSLVYSLSHSS